MPWYIPILAAVITASATLTVYIAGEYFSMKAHLPTAAEALVNSLNTAIAHANQASKGTTVYGRRHVTPEEFHAFRSNLWPWHMCTAEKLWKRYTQTHDPTEQLQALTFLLAEVRRRYPA